MADEFGYDKDRFINYHSDNFDCPICSGVAKNPKDCNQCGAVFCSSCIDQWLKKKNECINRCPKGFQISPIPKALKRIYDELELKCQICQKSIKITDIEQHEAMCRQPKCQNYEICGNIISKQKELSDLKVCDHTCLLLSRVKGNKTKQEIFQAVKQFVKERQLQVPDQQQMEIEVQQKPGQLVTFKWDKQRLGTGIQVTDADAKIFLKEQAYMFRSAVASHGFTGGINYWEIEADERTENELKIGVTTQRDFNYNTAFCDFEYGWAYYGLGQLRHNSNATGPAFGKRFKRDGVLGICLNMNNGTLKFSLNGEFMGVAYQDEKLKIGPIYPAVSLLHCAGCKLITGKQVPAIFL